MGNGSKIFRSFRVTAAGKETFLLPLEGPGEKESATDNDKRGACQLREHIQDQEYGMWKDDGGCSEAASFSFPSGKN